MARGLKSATRFNSFLRKILIRWSVTLRGSYFRTSKANALSMKIIPEIAVIDVGASHFLHKKWIPAFQSFRTSVIAVDPNESNLTYLESIRIPARLVPFSKGLSRNGGLKTLFVTNVDTGSSIKNPSPSPIVLRRLGESLSQYLFPLRELQIPTETLEAVVTQHNLDSPLFIKLDTQGSELDILEGAERLFNAGQIVLVESEASLLRETIYEDATKLPELTKFMESKGFDLVDLKVMKSKGQINKSRGILLECDATFVMGFERTLQSKLEVRLAVLYAYLLIGQKDLAQRLLSVDDGLRQSVLEVLSHAELDSLLKNFRSIT